MITLGNDGFHMTVTKYHTADNLEILSCGKHEEILRLLLTCVLFSDHEPHLLQGYS